MKQVFRTKVFETNSSSMHSFSIDKREEVKDIPKIVRVRGGYIFSWGYEVYNDPENKVAYLLGVGSNHIDEVKEYLREVFEKVGSILEIKEENLSINIDHESTDMPLEIFNEIKDDIDLGIKFIFGMYSKLIIDNDNH